MKALVSERRGPADTLRLRDLPEPVPGAGEVAVAVEACGINYPDVLMIEDRYQFAIERPFAPGIEICGRIASVGAGVASVGVGERVLAQVRAGGLAEMAIAPADRLLRVPDAVPPEIAAGFLLTYGTSFHALHDRARLQAGETLLVLGAGGGVGLAAVELGKRMGAHVVAAASSAEKAQAAREAGADTALVYARDVDPRAFATALKQACPSGADVIYDPVGGDYAEPALRAIAWEGRYLVVGFAAAIPRIPLNLVLLKGAQLIGVFWGAAIERDPPAMLASARTLIGWLADGGLRPRPPSPYPLARGGEAIAALAERRAVGKLVVQVRESGR